MNIIYSALFLLTSGLSLIGTGIAIAGRKIFLSCVLLAIAVTGIVLVKMLN